MITYSSFGITVCNCLLILIKKNQLSTLSKGEIKWTGTPRELEQQKDIRKNYLEV